MNEYYSGGLCLHLGFGQPMARVRARAMARLGQPMARVRARAMTRLGQPMARVRAMSRIMTMGLGQRQ